MLLKADSSGKRNFFAFIVGTVIVCLQFIGRCFVVVDIRIEVKIFAVLVFVLRRIVFFGRCKRVFGNRLVFLVVVHAFL
jgi:hypothetical protein